MTEEIDVNLKKRFSPASLLQWVGVVGVGSVLVFFVVPHALRSADRRDESNQAFIKEQAKDARASVKESATAMAQAAASMDKVSGELRGLSEQQEDLANQQQDLCRRLEPLPQLIKQLDRLADGIDRTTPKPE